MTDRDQKLAQAEQLQKAGRLEEAQQLCDELLARQAADAEVLARLASICGQRGDLDSAEAHLQWALQLRPEAVQLAGQLRNLRAVKQFRLGLVLAQQQRVDEAIACMLCATQESPEFFDAHRGLGILLAGQERFAEAATSLRRAAQLKPGDAQILYNLALAQQKQNDLSGAEATYRRVLELNPGDADTLNNLGVVLAALGRTAEAEAAFRGAIDGAANLTGAQSNLADLLLHTGRPAEAEACCRRALELGAEPVAAHYDLAVMLAAQNKLADAAAEYRETIALAPDYVDAHVGLAAALLGQGDFAAGWKEYEWRLKHRDMPQRPLPGATWQGQPLDGRTILLRTEQGAGDAVQFVRFAGLLKQQNATVLVGCAANLRHLLATCPGVDAAHARDEPLPGYDYHVPLLSVPGLLNATLETIPADVPYLFPSAATRAGWRDELGGQDVLKIGIAWQGNPAQRRDVFRSIPIAHFAGLVRTPGVRVYSLQFGPGREQLAQVAADWPVVDLADRLGDFHDTAACVANLDLVISCDSVPAHLAGALGVPVWVALAFASDWRWFVDRPDSPWYPTMHLFRQPRPGDWEGTFRQIEVELARLVDARSAG